MFFKKRVTSDGSEGEGTFRDMYKVFFQSFRLLPDAVARQSPRLLFDLFCEKEEKQGTADVPAELKFFYGL